MKRTTEPAGASAAPAGPSGGLADDFVTIAPELVTQIERHARSAYPEECCGILVGVSGSPTRICSARPTGNRRVVRAHDRYEIDPREILRADRAAEGDGREIVGFYHSHPDHPARPSATDREFAWPGYVYLIISVHGPNETAVGVWSFDEGGQRFRERALDIRAERAEAVTEGALDD